MARKDALIRFYFRVNPEKLKDKKWAKYYSEIEWVLLHTGTLVPK